MLYVFCALHGTFAEALSVKSLLAVLYVCIYWSFENYLSGSCLVAIVGAKKKAEVSLDWTSPRAVFDYLGRFVKSQEEARIAVATVFSNYAIRVLSRDSSLPRQHLLIVGPTGSGKSLMVERLAEKLDIPYVETKLTGKAADGFTGDILSNSFRGLIVQTRNNRRYSGMEHNGVKAPPGVVFCDELCKLARTERNAYNFSVELQDSLIGWSSEGGTTITMSDDSHYQLNTANLLFVAAGAFEGSKGKSLYDIASKRVKKEGSASSLIAPTSDELIRYGLKPELVGRFSSRAFTQRLTVEDLEAILTGAEGSVVGQYVSLFSARGYDVEFAQGALRVIAEKAPKETGARALNELCSTVFNHVAFYADIYAKGKRLIVTPELVKSLLP